MRMTLARVPNEYRCVICSDRISALGSNPPSCPTCGPGTPMGGVSWQEIAEERDQALEKLKNERIELQLEVASWKVRMWIFFGLCTIESIWILFRGMP